ncbi:hypothetical protein [uncultured Sulfitobacter sp.]|uniref:COG3904 family protein n=1 Tax=uncultured Sulfitobacter sp. TaxID=191468 RepID=UPI002610E24F|nr:hypothetical protein [uncultured Sulfitobacter sp.]
MRRGLAAGLLAAGLGLCLSLPVAAQDEQPSGSPQKEAPTATPDSAADKAPDTSQRYRVDGTSLIFDTVAKLEGKERGVRGSDVKALRNLLRRHRGITVLELESTGGNHYASMEIGALVIDFGLDTHVRNICESSCVTIFLGGTNRTLARGGRLGFHQLYWTPDDVEEYYKDNKEWGEWDTPFDFASWMYQDTQTETFNRLSYMINRGVDPTFAIQSLRKPDASMWRPYRAVLLAAGVLTE